MINKWKKMPPGERLRTQIVIMMLMIGFYGLVFYPLFNKKYAESEKFLNRKKDRLEKRTKIEDIPTGINPETTRKKIEKIDLELKTIASDFDELDTGFAPVDDSNVRQQLMLEISKLAERTGVSLLSVKRKGGLVEGGMAPPVLDPTLQRPLLIIDAQTRFWYLVDFIEGMKDMSFHISVMNLKLYSDQPDKFKKRSQALPPGVLHVSLEVSI